MDATVAKNVRPPSSEAHGGQAGRLQFSFTARRAVRALAQVGEASQQYMLCTAAAAARTLSWPPRRRRRRRRCPPGAPSRALWGRCRCGERPGPPAASPRQPHRGGDHRVHGEPRPFQLEGVGAEGVRGDEAGACSGVLPMDIPDQVGVGEVQGLGAAQLSASRLKHGAHAPCRRTGRPAPAPGARPPRPQFPVKVHGLLLFL